MIVNPCWNIEVILLFAWIKGPVYGILSSGKLEYNIHNYVFIKSSLVKFAFLSTRGGGSSSTGSTSAFAYLALQFAGEVGSCSLQPNCLKFYTLDL